MATSASQPLAGIRVLELAQGIAGPYAGRMLADYGADVIKIEPPAGDWARHEGPFLGDQSGPERSALFLHLNSNKRSVVLDLARSEDLTAVRQLLATVDLVIESCPPGELDRAGLGFEAARDVNHDIVMTSITPFGLDGPYASYQGEEIIYSAMGGPMNSTGVAEREPLKLGGNVVQYQAGNVAATATLAALMVTQHSGHPIHVDVSILEAQEASIDRRLCFLVGYAYTGESSSRDSLLPLPLPMGIYPRADGYVQIMTIPAWMPRMAAALGDRDLAAALSDPAALADPHTADLVDGVLYPWLAERSKAQATADAQAHSWPVAALNTTADVVADGHLEQRGFFVEADHHAAGRVTHLGPPFRMRDGWALRHPAPALGQHTAEVIGSDHRLDDEGCVPTSRPRKPADVAPAEPSREPALPLEGLRVLDMTVVWSGPYTTMLLADLGAEVIRIDNPWIFPSSSRGLTARPSRDQAANMGAVGRAYPDLDPGDRPWNRHAMYTCHARGKRCCTLDLRQESGRDLFLRLVELSDVLVENNAARVLDKLGLGWETLTSRNPKFIVLRMPPLGLSGPHRDYVGFGAHFEALSGFTSVRGYADADPTTTTPSFHMDPASGATGAFAVMAALLRRRSTGMGELIELPQGENLMHHIGELLVGTAHTGTAHSPPGNRHLSRAPQGAYRCAGDDRWAVISVGTDIQWRGLRRAMGDPAWAADSRFDTAEGRRAAHDQIDAGITAWTGTLDPYTVFHTCQREGVPAGPVMDEADAYSDPHLRARGFFREMFTPHTGTHEYPAHLWHWNGPPLRWEPLHGLGEDNEYVYKQILGLSDDEYSAAGEEGHLSMDYLDARGQPL